MKITITGEELTIKEFLRVNKYYITRKNLKVEFEKPKKEAPKPKKKVNKNKSE